MSRRSFFNFFQNEREMTIIPFPETRQGCGAQAKTWLTLPVAPHAAARLRFCGEEKLPQAVPPPAALNWLDSLLEKGRGVAGAEMDGPGDPMATLPLALDTVALFKDRHPELPLGIVTLGFGLDENAQVLAEQGVSRVTLLINALEPEVLQKLYAWIRPGKRNMPLGKAVSALVDAQSRALAACRAAGITVSVRTAVYAGVNEQEVEGIARHVANWGVTSMTLLPGQRCAGNEGAAEVVPAPQAMQDLCAVAALFVENVDLPQPADCCEVAVLPTHGAMALPKPAPGRPNVAVVSSNGMDIDLHLGQAIRVLVYGPRGEDGLACLLETRSAPEPGGGADRWQNLAKTLPDCFALLTASAGASPRQILAQSGITVVVCEDEIEGAVDLLYGGGKKKRR